MILLIHYASQSTATHLQLNSSSQINSSLKPYQITTEEFRKLYAKDIAQQLFDAHFKDKKTIIKNIRHFGIGFVDAKFENGLAFPETYVNKKNQVQNELEKILIDAKEVIEKES